MQNRSQQKTNQLNQNEIDKHKPHEGSTPLGIAFVTARHLDRPSRVSRTKINSNQKGELGIEQGLILFVQPSLVFCSTTGVIFIQPSMVFLSHSPLVGSSNLGTV
jgi:hypothetical protein